MNRSRCNSNKHDLDEGPTGDVSFLMPRRSHKAPTAPLEVWKFGGASLADAAAIQRAVALIASHNGPLVVVASALAGITDLLLSGAQESASGVANNAAARAAAFLQRHRPAVKALVPPGKKRRALLAKLDE